MSDGEQIEARAGRAARRARPARHARPPRSRPGRELVIPRRAQRVDGRARPRRVAGSLVRFTGMRAPVRPAPARRGRVAAKCAPAQGHGAQPQHDQYRPADRNPGVERDRRRVVEAHAAVDLEPGLVQPAEAGRVEPASGRG